MTQVPSLATEEKEIKRPGRDRGPDYERSNAQRRAKRQNRTEEEASARKNQDKARKAAERADKKRKQDERHAAMLNLNVQHVYPLRAKTIEVYTYVYPNL